jgi:hypothetical protein
MEPVPYDTLKQLRDHIPRLADLLKIGNNEEIRSWQDVVDAKLLSRFAPDFPMVAAICGGGSSGKSTLFNSLVKEPLAPTGGTAGLNRRILFSIPAACTEQTRLLADLARPFQSELQPLQDTVQLTTPGEPLYVVNQSALNNLVLLDTPDFDTGAKGAYTNREITRMALEASDILIYVFTNSNYNNRDNTEFISRMLTGIGMRSCFLVYRVYPSFTRQEVYDHAMTVARGIYGDRADQFLLGIYRTDEDNAVAAGRQFMRLEPLEKSGSDFSKALASIDGAALRFELYGSILSDVIQQAAHVTNQSKVSRDELQLYLDALQMAQSHSVQEALKHFPMDRVMRRFAHIWAKTDPPHVKFMRRTGNVIEFPLKMLLGAAGWARDQLLPEGREPAPAKEFVKKLDEDLATAVTKMNYQAVSSQISVSGSLSDPIAGKMAEVIEQIRVAKNLDKAQPPSAEPSGEGPVHTFLVDAHPVVFSAQEKLRAGDFKSILQTILAEKDNIVAITQDMERDLEKLSDQFRSKMGLWRKISQTFWAFLNVLPATVAVTYVLSTGDPVGAAGIKVKLAGLFGAKDLYALFAIPVTTGLKSADRKQIEEMLAPIVRTWLNHKLNTVQALFETNITGEILKSARQNLENAETLISASEQLMSTLTRRIERLPE